VTTGVRIIVCPSQYIYYCKEMDQELLHRLLSFVKWPMDGTTASPVLLANAGFVYSGHGLWVTCPHCCMMVEGKRTNAEFNARYKHRMESPQCPLALECSKSDTGSQYANVNTIPADHSSSNDRTIGIATSEATHDIAVNTAVSQSRDVPGVLYSATAHHAGGGCAHESNVSDSIDRQNPDFNRLRAEAIRLGTFYDWPTTANVQAAELAADGWFFTGRSDRVRCAFCRGVLHNWAENDEPASEHRRHFPNCFFVKGRNVGNVPLAKTKTASASEPQPREYQWSASRTGSGDMTIVSNRRTLGGVGSEKERTEGAVPVAGASNGLYVIHNAKHSVFS
jgi:hypothetical protein